VAAPSIKVEVAFSTQPFSTSPVWTDISSSVQGFTTKRGRSYELDRIEAGTCGLILDNSDGAFTPGRTSSAYYPYVKPKRRLRITVVKNAVTYAVYDGFVERWPVEFNGAIVAEVSIEASDAFRHLSDITLNTPMREACLDGTPTWYWPLTDDAGAPYASNLAEPVVVANRVISPVGVGSAQFGGAAIIDAPEVDDNGTTWAVSGADSNAMAVLQFLDGGGPKPWPYALNSTFAWACFWKGPLPTTTDYSLFYLADASGNTLVSFRLQPGGNLSLTVKGATGTQTSTWVGAVPVGNKTYQLGFSVTPTGMPNGELAILVNGDPGPGGSTFAYTKGALAATPMYGMMGGEMVGSSRNYGMNGSMSHAVLRISAAFKYFYLSSQGTTYLSGVAYPTPAPESARFDRVLFHARIPSAWTRTYDASLSKLTPLQWASGSSALELLQGFADDAGGVLFMGTSGEFVYQNRHHRIGAPVAATFKHSDGTGYEPHLTLVMDEDRVVNDVTVTRPGGSTARASDAASIGEYGRKTREMTLRIDNDGEAWDAATWAVEQGKDAKVRIDGVTLNLGASDALWSVVLGLKLGDKIVLDELPEAAPFTTGEFFVEGIDHDCTVVGSGVEWMTQLRLSPAEDSDGWVLEDDENGILDSTTTAVY
jgi:hypothetical protein